MPGVTLFGLSYGERRARTTDAPWLHWKKRGGQAERRKKRHEKYRNSQPPTNDNHVWGCADDVGSRHVIVFWNIEMPCNVLIQINMSCRCCNRTARKVDSKTAFVRSSTMFPSHTTPVLVIHSVFTKNSLNQHLAVLSEEIAIK